MYEEFYEMSDDEAMEYLDSLSVEAFSEFAEQHVHEALENGSCATCDKFPCGLLTKFAEQHVHEALSNGTCATCDEFPCGLLTKFMQDEDADLVLLSLLFQVIR